MNGIGATYRKQPSEQLDYRVSYATWATDGQTLSSATVAVARQLPDTNAGTLVVDGPYIEDTTTLLYTVSAGLDGETYQITLVATMNSGEKVEVDVIMNVEES